MRASNARIAGVFSGILFAVCGGFAAGFAENANAQMATFQVFEHGPTAVQVGSGSDMLNLSSGVDAAFLAYDIRGGDISRYFDLIEGDGTVVPGVDAGNAYVSFGGTIMIGLPARTTLRFWDKPDDTAPTLDFTIRIYLEGEGATRFAFPATPATASAAESPQFFLDENFMPTRTPATTNVGYVAPTCTGTDITVGGLMCVPLKTAESCEEMTPPRVLDSVNNECDLPSTSPQCAMLNADRPIFADGETGNCREVQTIMDCSAGQNVDLQQTGLARCVAECPQTRPANSEGICTAPGENGDGTTTVTTAPPATETAAGGGDSNENKIIGLGGAVAVGLLAWYIGEGNPDLFGFSRAFGYSMNEGGYSANVGGRVDFQKDEWRLFWTAGQANANGAFGEFRYSSGGEYKTDFWQASFSESVQGERADYDFSLSADMSSGIWSLSPVYRMHSRLEEGESATRNSLNLEGVLRYEDWRITPSAGFGWRRTEEFADNARFRLEAVRKF